MTDLESVEFADNPDPRCPCVLLLDTSGSMEGVPIAALNEGLAAFQKDIKEDELAQRRTEIALVTFRNGGVQVLNHTTRQLQSATDVRQLESTFVTAGEFTPPTLVAGAPAPCAPGRPARVQVPPAPKRQHPRHRT